MVKLSDSSVLQLFSAPVSIVRDNTLQMKLVYKGVRSLKQQKHSCISCSFHPPLMCLPRPLLSQFNLLPATCHVYMSKIILGLCKSDTYISYRKQFEKILKLPARFALAVSTNGFKGNVKPPEDILNIQGIFTPSLSQLQLPFSLLFIGYSHKALCSF